MNASQKERQQRTRNEVHALIVAAKQVPCARCKHSYPSVCMDFDHLPGFEKTINIGSPKHWTSVARIRAEIQKCQVLCSNCHRIVTWERRHGVPCPPAQEPKPNVKKNFLRGYLTRVNGWDRV